MAMKTTKSWRLISILFGLCSTFQVADAAPDDLAETSAYEEDGGITIDHSGKSPVGFFQGTFPLAPIRISHVLMRNTIIAGKRQSGQRTVK